LGVEEVGSHTHTLSLSHTHKQTHAHARTQTHTPAQYPIQRQSTRHRFDPRYTSRAHQVLALPAPRIPFRLCFEDLGLGFGVRGSEFGLEERRCRIFII
jgi:hypothetical protein